ncbi:MAG: sugar nucleotide-binding protein [Bacteroidota bacterium]
MSSATSALIRTARAYAAEGENFVRTMLELGRERGELRVVNGQWGSPTVPATLRKIDRLLSHAQVRGTFHYAGASETTWLHFAEFIFAHVERYRATPAGGNADMHAISRRRHNAGLFGFSTPLFTAARSVRDCRLGGPAQPAYWKSSG